MFLAPCRFRRCQVECELHSPAHLHKGVTYTVLGILTCIKRLTIGCLQLLHHRARRLDKTGHHCAYTGDADRPCQEQVRTRSRARASSKASHDPPQTGETTCLYQNGPDAPGSSVEGWQGPASKRTSLVQEDDTPTMASQGIQALLEIAVQSTFCQTKDLRRDRGLEKARWQATIDCGEQNVYEANDSRLQSACLQEDRPEVHKSCAPSLATRTKVEHLFTHPCRADLGLRRLSQ